jgi:hypothetical protein
MKTATRPAGWSEPAWAGWSVIARALFFDRHHQRIITYHQTRDDYLGTVLRELQFLLISVGASKRFSRRFGDHAG